jgi:hypothetical protein
MIGKILGASQAAGGVPYVDSANGLVNTGAGTAGQFLKSNGASAPTWATATATLVYDAYFYSGHAGFGSTNNKIPYYTSAVASVSGGVGTIANSATDGFSFTAAKKCLVLMFVSARDDAYHGISLNSNQLTTGVVSINSAHRIALNYNGGGDLNSIGQSSATTLMQINDVIRPHQAGSAPTTSSQVELTLIAFEVT